MRRACVAIGVARQRQVKLHAAPEALCKPRKVEPWHIALARMRCDRMPLPAKRPRLSPDGQRPYVIGAEPGAGSKAMPPSPRPGETQMLADSQRTVALDPGRPDESHLWQPEDDRASARMLGTAMLIAIAGYTAIGVGLWRRRAARRR